MNQTLLTVVLVVAGVACVVAAQFVGESARELVQQAGVFLVGLAINPTKLAGGAK